MNPVDALLRRAVLVCPGSATRKVAGALSSAADEVVVDLEDAVTPAYKDDARRDLQLLTARAGGGAIAVRVNGPDTPWFADDLRAVAALGDRVASVVVPKVESPGHLDQVEQILDVAGAEQVQLQALIETARGLRDVDRVAASGGRLRGLILGYADLGAELGRSPSAPRELWLAVQDRVLTAARAAGVQAIDGPALHTAPDDRLRAAADQVAALGFDGKWVIHPAQVEAVTTAFTPDTDAVTHARAVLDALEAAETAGSGAVRLGGMMLDEAVAVAARRTLLKAGGTQR